MCVDFQRHFRVLDAAANRTNLSRGLLDILKLESHLDGCCRCVCMRACACVQCGFLGVEPRASCTVRQVLTTELYPQPPQPPHHFYFILKFLRHALTIYKTDLELP